MKQGSDSAKRLRLLLPLIAAGAFTALVVVTFRDFAPKSVSASSVRRQVIEITLEGGFIGPFKVRAESFEPVSGEFARFTASTDRLLIGARRATFSIDTDADTITLHLFEAEILGEPDDDGEEREIVSREALTIGPLPYKDDITPDGPDRVLPAEDALDTHVQAKTE